MTELKTEPRASALAEIPDAPATLEFRSLALDPESSAYRSGAGLVLLDSKEQQLGAAGAIDRDDVLDLIRSRRLTCEVLADEAAYDVLRGDIPFEPAKVFALDAAWRPGHFDRPEVLIRELESTDSIAHVPGELHDELTAARARSFRILAAFVDGAPVSFSYSASMTETLADISIDTLEAHRGRGIGMATAARLIDWVDQIGKQPVWGALATNGPSLRLAEKLGFRRYTGRLFVAESPHATIDA
jgi:GNAT superfamily N-acetyltransferase